MNTSPVIFLSIRRRYCGQNFAAFLLLFFMVFLGFAILGDFSRWMNGFNAARTLSDNAALAAAGSADANKFNNGSTTLNIGLAKLRAEAVVETWLLLRNGNENFIHLSLTGLSIQDTDVTVTVSGSVDSVFGKFFGVPSYPISRTSHAKLVFGITREE